MSVKLNLSEMLSTNGNGSYSFSISKAQNGVIVNISCNYNNPDGDPAVNFGKNETYVYEGTDSEVLTKLNTLGFDNVAEINQ